MVTPLQSQAELLDEKPPSQNAQDEPVKEEAQPPEEEKIYATGLTLNLIVIGLTLSVLLVALVI